MRRILLLGFCLGLLGQSILANPFRKLPCNCSNTVQVRGNLKFDNLLKTFLDKIAVTLNKELDSPPTLPRYFPSLRLPDGNVEPSSLDTPDYPVPEIPDDVLPMYELTFRIFNTSNDNSLPTYAPTPPTIDSSIAPNDNEPIAYTTPAPVTLYPEDLSPDDFPAIIQWIKEVNINRVLYIINSIGGISKVPDLTNNWRRNPYLDILLEFLPYPARIDSHLPSYEVPVEPDTGILGNPNNEPIPQIPMKLLIYIIKLLKSPTDDDGQVENLINKFEDFVKDITTFNYLIDSGFKLEIVIRVNDPNNPNNPDSDPQSSLRNIYNPLERLSKPNQDVENPHIPTILLILLKKYINIPDSNQFEPIIWRLEDVLTKVKQLNRLIFGRFKINIKFKFFEHPNGDRSPTLIIVEPPNPNETGLSELQPNGHVSLSLIPNIFRLIFRRYQSTDLLDNGLQIIRRIKDLVLRMTKLNGIINSGLKIILTIKFTRIAQQHPSIRDILEFFAIPNEDHVKLNSKLLVPKFELPPRFPSVILGLFKKFLNFKNDVQVGNFIWGIIDIITTVKKLNKLIRNGLIFNFKFKHEGTLTVNRYYPTHIIVEPPGYNPPAEYNILIFFQKYLEAHVNIDDIDLEQISGEHQPTNAFTKNLRHELSSSEFSDLIRGLKGNNENIKGFQISFNSIYGNSLQKMDQFLVTLRDQVNKMKHMDPKNSELLNLLNHGGGELKMNVASSDSGVIQTKDSFNYGDGYLGKKNYNNYDYYQ